MFEHWMKLPEETAFDFSSLRGVVLGGSAVSAKDKRRYAQFLKKHGAADVLLFNGYGISELGGACMNQMNQQGLQMMQQMFSQNTQMMQQWMLSLGMNAMNAQQKGASIPGLNLPGLDLQKLLQMEASPTALEGLQKVLDMVFDAYTGQKED